MAWPKNSFFLISLLLSAGALAFALASQYGWGLHPCVLCIVQRYPYAAIVVVALVGLRVKSARVRRGLMALCIALFLLDAGIAFYHTGVERGVFEGTSACSSAGAEGQTLEEMRAAIMDAPLVSCNQPMAEFLGLSMATWNGFYALLSAAVLAFVWRRDVAR